MSIVYTYRRSRRYKLSSILSQKYTYFLNRQLFPQIFFSFYVLSYQSDKHTRTNKPLLLTNFPCGKE